MQIGERIQLKRTCEAVRVPDGAVVTLEEGAPVTLMQSLGDTYTVMTDMGMMARIAGADGDALGKEIVELPDLSDSGLSIKDQVLARLRTCYDPEIPVNIVELGLIYECEVTPSEEGGYNVMITMTLTAPGCGMGDVLASDIRRKVSGIRDVRLVTVDVVFDPPWDRSRMSEAAQLQMGMM